MIPIEDGAFGISLRLVLTVGRFGVAFKRIKENHITQNILDDCPAL